MAPRILAGEHLRATPAGDVVLHLAGDGLARVTLRSARRIPTRWLGSGQPRLVRFGMRVVTLRPDAITDVTLRLSREHLAMLHRMQSVRVTIRLQTAAGVRKRRVTLHAPTSGRRRRQPAAIG